MVKVYPFSVTETMLDIINKEGKSLNGQMLYAITQAELQFPNTIVEKVAYQFLPNSTEDPIGKTCGEHRWNIHMKNIDELK